MKAIIGLGNPGRQYMRTRHNIGFHIIDALAERTCSLVTKKKFHAQTGEFFFLGEKVLLVKPQTYMNRSGVTVNAVRAFYTKDLPVERILLVYDDVALPFGTVRVRAHGSAGGHNGVRSIVDTCKTELFARVRVGIGADRLPDDLSQFVLGKFTAEEQGRLDDIETRVCDACLSWLEYGIEKTMNRFN